MVQCALMASRMQRKWRPMTKREVWKDRLARLSTPRNVAKGGLLLLVAFFLWIASLWWTLPDLTDPRTFTADQSSVFLDAKGREMERVHKEEDRTWIEPTTIPAYMKNAIIAIEDKRFYEHGCIDPRGILRAVFVTLTGRGSQGGSTISQQLARNAVLTREKTITRKIREIMVACSLERRYGKDELLGLYLNWVPFGPNAYGIELASKQYFGISATQLSLGQAAILASLPQRPSYLDPFGNHVRTSLTPEGIRRLSEGKITSAADLRDDDVRLGLLGQVIGTGSSVLYVGGRSDQVLKEMETMSVITNADRLRAVQELQTISFTRSEAENGISPYAALWIRDQVSQLLGSNAEEGILEQGGLTIETTIDMDMQRAAEKVVKNRRVDIAKLTGAHNLALVSIDPHTSEIRAYIGNADYADTEHGGKIDMTRVPRQPGSSFKPIVYAAAFLKGFSPATVLYDLPIRVGTYEPQNFDGQFWGQMNIRRALAASRNVPAIKAYFLAGEEGPILDFAAQMGAPTPKALIPAKGYGPSLALGAAETPLTEMVQAFGTLANSGLSTPPHVIRRITDKRGNILFAASAALPSLPVLDERIAYQITSILSDTSARPNAYWQQVLTIPGFATAAKTGTSNKCIEQRDDGNCKTRRPSDLWTIGYTPSLLTGVWVGNADASPLSPTAEALTTAAPLWKDFMTAAHAFIDAPIKTFPLPPNMVQVQISLLSGQLPSACTPIDLRATDIFLAEHAPNIADPGCRELMIDRLTNLLVSHECPAEASASGSFLVPQGVLIDRFPAWQESIEAWAKKQMEGYDPLTRTFVSGSLLPLPLAPTEQCRLRLTPGREIPPSIAITVPAPGAFVPFPLFQPQFTVRVGSDIREIRAAIDGKTVASATESPFKITVRTPKSVKKDGTHRLTLTVVDTYLNEAEQSVDFIFGDDTLPPSLRFVQPHAGDTFRRGEPIALAVSAEDREGGIKYVEFFLDDILLSTKPAEPFALSYADAAVGFHTFRAVATDLAGNKSSDSVQITVMGTGE